MDRRSFLRTLGLGTAAQAVWPAYRASGAPARKPNIIFILADDLGYGEVGAFGQTKIRTPNIDALAREGMKLPQHYSGSPVCAPSRCVLLTGQHTGHAYIRDNDEMGDRGDVWHDPALEGQRPLHAGTVTIGSMLRQAGYATAIVGKWGLGGPASTGEPNRQGFDFFFGYLCQRVAHNHYPAYLWRNATKVPLPGNPGIYPHQKLPADRDPKQMASYREYSGTQYALDLMGEQARAFIRQHKDQPFFLYFTPTIPHAALQVPEDALREYDGAFPETPYLGDKGYLPHPLPRAAYAAMVTRMDREVGRIVALLKELGLEKDTLIVFTSDNGPTFNGGTDSAFFQSAGSFRGLKQSLYEGGIRVPTIARWPGQIPAGSVSQHVSAFQDFCPTFAELAGAGIPAGTDGLSMSRALGGQPGAQRAHPYLYWEFSGKQAVRLGDWKAIRTAATGAMELYNLKDDIGERTDVAAREKDVVARIDTIMKEARTESTLFPLARKKT
jgi:arylsulfatase